jgi:hypothetical protein
MDWSVTHKIVYGPQLRFGPYNILWVTSRSINCHMATFIKVLYLYTIHVLASSSILCHRSVFILVNISFYDFSHIFVFVSADGQYFRILTGQYFSIWTGADQYNVFFQILSELVFCLRYTITKTCHLTDLHVYYIDRPRSIY